MAETEAEKTAGEAKEAQDREEADNKIREHYLERSRERKY